MEGNGNVWSKVSGSRGGGAWAPEMKFSLDIELSALESVSGWERGACELVCDKEEGIDRVGLIARKKAGRKRVAEKAEDHAERRGGGNGGEGGGGSVGEFNFENAEVRILGVSKGGEEKVAFAWTGAGRLVGDGNSDWVLLGVVA